MSSGGDAISDDALQDGGLEMAGGEDGEAHGELAAVGEKGIVLEVAVLGGEADGVGGGEAGFEAGDPARSGGDDGVLEEVGFGEGEDDVEGGAAGEGGLGEKDVGSGGEGAVGGSDVFRGEEGVDAVADGLFFFGGEAFGASGAGDDVAGVVGDGGEGEAAGETAELALGGGGLGVFAFAEGRDDGKELLKLRELAEDGVGFGLGGASLGGIFGGCGGWRGWRGPAGRGGWRRGGLRTIFAFAAAAAQRQVPFIAAQAERTMG